MKDLPFLGPTEFSSSIGASQTLNKNEIDPRCFISCTIKTPRATPQLPQLPACFFIDSGATHNVQVSQVPDTSSVALGKHEKFEKSDKRDVNHRGNITIPDIYLLSFEILRMSANLSNARNPPTRLGLTESGG